MKSIRELRMSIRFNPEPCNIRIAAMAEHYKLDFDVYLPNLKMNLQRDYCWTIDQKRELVWSVLKKRHIPRISLLNTMEDVYQVIDGKQRLSTMITFYKNDFSLEIDGVPYYFDDLPEDYKNAYSGYMIPLEVVNEESHSRASDFDKIDWFKYINFAGTLQDKMHLDYLSKNYEQAIKISKTQ